MMENEKSIFVEIKVAASVEDVWAAWTTENGVKSFFAPDCKIDLCPDGMYEIYFNPDAPHGEKGGEGLRILAIQPMSMFSFTWNAPPTLPEVRGQRTHVIIRFQAEYDNETTVRLIHQGWGTGGEWEDAYQYFNRAWREIVLPRLKLRFEQGPIDWENPPPF
ncbi:MAG: SRPBCC domain-containing protein [Gammaproteobacteria bacterium]|nr:SRPBCC domain-containing protein [Gammaproteobacteria bacterium]